MPIGNYQRFPFAVPIARTGTIFSFATSCSPLCRWTNSILASVRRHPLPGFGSPSSPSAKRFHPSMSVGCTKDAAFALLHDFKLRLLPNCVPAATTDGLRSYSYALTMLVPTLDKICAHFIVPPRRTARYPEQRRQPLFAHHIDFPPEQRLQRKIKADSWSWIAAHQNKCSRLKQRDTRET
jgi:hypothetical protein